jgi:hypothetical protein
MAQSLTRIVCFVLLLASSAFAQSDQGNLTVTSFPTGTIVTLEGEYTLTGVTPVTFNQSLRGVYKLTAFRDGYEDYETRVVLTDADPMQVDFEMVQKTRFKAAFRSLVIPGWGQIYTKQRLRGVLYTSATVLSLVSLYVTENSFQDKKDDYNAILGEYEQTRSIDGKRAIRGRLDDAQEEAYDAETVRNIAFGVTAFIWAFNVIDAIVFFPDRRHSIGGPANITLDTGSNFDRLGLKLAISF